MSAIDRVRRVSGNRLTERQARFLVTVMQHSGVCVPRQFPAFAGIKHGQRTVDLFERLVRWGYAVAYPCRHHRGRVYHIRYKPLYRAIGDADSRFRRPMSAAQVVDRLAMLDALIGTPNVTWLGGAEDRQAHFAGGLPEVVKHLPVGVEPDGRVVLLFLVMRDRLDEFRVFLQECSSFLSRRPTWTIRVVLARQFQWLSKLYDDKFRYDLGPGPRHMDELRWYFQQRQAVSQDPQALREEDEERYYEDRFAFGERRYQTVYKRWLKEGEQVLELLSSRVIPDSIASGAGRLECAVLPFSYRLLSPLVDVAQPRSGRAENLDNDPTRPQPSTDWLDRIRAMVEENGASLDDSAPEGIAW